MLKKVSKNTVGSRAMLLDNFESKDNQWKQSK
jgi:hypothetical protein